MKCASVPLLDPVTAEAGVITPKTHPGEMPQRGRKDPEIRRLQRWPRKMSSQPRLDLKRFS